MSRDHSHLRNSVDYHSGVVQPYIVTAAEEVNADSFAKIQKQADLLNSVIPQAPALPAPCLATIVIKPNQPLNVVLRALKSIANLNPEGLSHNDPNYVAISKIEYIAGYSQKQLDLLYEHDLVFDENLSARYKKNNRLAFFGIFDPRQLRLPGQLPEHHSQPVFQAQISGYNALPKLKALVGPKDPVKGTESSFAKSAKETLGSFYGVDRLDNAFFVSETIHEAMVEDKELFGQTENSDDNIDLKQTWQITGIKSKDSKTSANSELTPVRQILLQN